MTSTTIALKELLREAGSSNICASTEELRRIARDPRFKDWKGLEATFSYITTRRSLTVLIDTAEMMLREVKRHPSVTRRY
jgi:hypothetical protein